MSATGKLISQSRNLLLMLHITNMHFGIPQQLRHALPPLRTTDDIHHCRAGLFDRLRARIGHTLFVGDTENEYLLASQT